MAQTLMAHSPGLARTITMVSKGHFMHTIIHPGWLELPLARTIFMVPSLFEPLKFYCNIIWAGTGENLPSGFPTK